MVDWTDTEFLAVLVFDIAAIVVAVWWISGRFTSKMREVEERMSHKGLEKAVESEE
jgi:transposase-like protein